MKLTDYGNLKIVLLGDVDFEPQVYQSTRGHSSQLEIDSLEMSSGSQRILFEDIMVYLVGPPTRYLTKNLKCVQILSQVFS